MKSTARPSSRYDRRILRVFAAFFPLFGACSSSAPRDSVPAPAPAGVSRADIVDVIYEQGTNDEGVLTLLGAPVVGDPSAEPVVTAPLEHAALSTPETFTYHVGASARHVRPRPSHHGWPAWLTLEHSAFAHGIPMNGDAFLLVFSTPGDSKVLRVFTQDRSYVPSTDEWQRLSGESGPFTLTITHAIFEQGRLTEDGGPFVGQALHFSVVH